MSVLFVCSFDCWCLFCLSFGLLGSGPGLWARPREGWWWGWGGHHVGQEHPGLPLQGEGQEKENRTHSLLRFLFT